MDDAEWICRGLRIKLSYDPRGGGKKVALTLNAVSSGGEINSSPIATGGWLGLRIRPFGVGEVLEGGRWLLLRCISCVLC